MSHRLLKACFVLALPSAASSSLLIGFVGEGLLAATAAAEDAGGLVFLLVVDVDGLQRRLPVWAPMANRCCCKLQRL
jgi:hypothetical protein